MYVRFSNYIDSSHWQKLNIDILMGCIISPLLFILVMEMMICSAEVNTYEITGPSVKVFM